MMSLASISHGRDMVMIGLVMVGAAAVLVVLYLTLGTGSSDASTMESLRQQALVTSRVLAASDHLNVIRAAGALAGVGVGMAGGSVFVYRRKRI